MNTVITQKMWMPYLRGFFVIECIPSCVLEILEVLEKRGHISYLVGGCVRDILMKKNPKDWDICTPATPNELKEIFPTHFAMGERFGTIGVQTAVGIVELTTFRKELEYIDFRHPKVSFVKDLETDLKRRDFGINAIAYHPRLGCVDLFGGQEDLQGKLLRCVGDASLRFKEDALRILRLVRFSCTLGFSPESQTLKEALKHKDLLSQIAKERIANELLLALQGEFLSDFFGTYREIFALVLPELQKPKKYKVKNLVLLLSLLFDEASAIASLGLEKKKRERIEVLIQYKNVEIFEDSVSIKMLLKEIGYDCFNALLELKKLMGKNAKKLYALVQMIMINDECFCLKDLQIKGDDLKKMGLEGKKIGEVLDSLLLEVIKGELCNTFDALHKRALYFSRI